MSPDLLLGQAGEATAALTISVIIPAHNEEALLPACVESARNSVEHAGVACEIIVVSDASRDATAAVGSRLGCRVYEMNFRSRARARNFGARGAKGQVLLFLDADSAPSRSLVAASLTQINERRSVLWYRQRPLERHLGASLFFAVTNLIGRFRPLFSPAILMTRQYFDASSGFDEDLRSLEDHEVLIRAWRRGVAAQSPAVVRTSIRRLRQFGLVGGLRDFLAAVRNPRGVDWKPIND